MDAINIISAIALFLSIVANSTATKGGLKKAVTKSERRPKTYLQKTPLNISAIVLILEILAIFQIGTWDYSTEFQYLRIGGLVFFVVFALLQVKSFKNLKNYYTQDVAILKNHQLITTGIHKNIRHPQYVSQVLSDLGMGIALFGYLIIPIVLLVELPLFILRAKKEDEMMNEYFGNQFKEYKKQSGFIIPFIG
ncbi:MAG: isoprenylcysteine carboxylmethyltransferase family protein [Bacteroidetes bacterium]|nr:isoprenylcysteine carboxylmethyltransferase family protein [Bacteroidota bacterium]MBU1116761.1 isoprenylcysteine carboxylmethyltransferase family protein [Bacteroidota bacterium]MBU1798850.1 isoprenylcysteine carboxylmethyltransferase family protein [Bacteroidota bacterium]